MVSVLGLSRGVVLRRIAGRTLPPVVANDGDHFCMGTAAIGWVLEKSHHQELRVNIVRSGPVHAGFVGMVQWVGDCQNAYDSAISLT